MNAISQSELAFTTMYNYCPPLEDRRLAALHYSSYIPVVGMIIAIVGLILEKQWVGFMVKGELGEPYRAFAARYIVVALCLGPLLLLVDLVGTIMKAALNKTLSDIDNRSIEGLLDRAYFF